MNIDEKRKTLLHAMEQGTQGIKLYPKGRGKAMSRLKKGEHVSDEIIKEAYQNLTNLTKGEEIEQISNKPKQTRTKQEQKTTIPEEVELLREGLNGLHDSLYTTSDSLQTTQKNVKKEIDSLKKEIATLKQEIQQIKTKQNNNTALPTLPTKIKPGEAVVMGFKIIETTTKTKGVQYRCYKANRSINGSHLSVYIGADPSLAEKKIQAYLKRNKKKLEDVWEVIEFDLQEVNYD